MRENRGNEIFVIVDEIERGRINLDRNNATKFNLNENSQEIELYRGGENGKKFLEIFPVNFDVLKKEPYKQSFTLKGGERVTFDFNPIKDSSGITSLVICGINFVDKKAITPATIAATANTATVGSAPKAAVANPTILETSPENRTSGNRVVLIPAAILLMLLLALGVGWFKYRDWNQDNDIAKDTTSENQKDDEVATKTFPKKEDIETDDEKTIQDDISSGGDDDDDVDFISKVETPDNSGNSVSSNSVTSNSTTSGGTSNASNLNSSSNIFGNSSLNSYTGSRSVLENKTSSDNRIKVVKRTSSNRTLSADNQNQATRAKTLKKGFVGSNRISADRFRLNPQKSTIEIISESPVETVDNSNQNVAVNIDNSNQDINKSNADNLINALPSNQVAVNPIAPKLDQNVIEQGAGGKSLLEVQKVYLEWQGDIATGVKINQKLVETIKGSGLFAVMQDKNDADAALKINIKHEKDGDSPNNPHVSADMWLVNNAGTVLTPTDNNETLWKYDGTLDEMPDKIVSDIDGLATVARKEQQNKEKTEAKSDNNKLAKAETKLKPGTRIDADSIRTAEVTDDKLPNKEIKADVKKVDNDVDSNGKSLLDVEKINLEWQGDIDAGVKINQEVVENIQYKSGLDVMNEKKDADATLKINIKKRSKGASADNPNVTADMSLINEKGKTLTPTKKGKSTWKYKGSLKKMPNQIVEDIGNLKKAETKKKQKEKKKVKQDNLN